MIVRNVKLKVNKTTEARLNEWLWQLAGCWNWAIRKIELDAKDGIYHSRRDFRQLADGSSKKVGLPGHTIQAVLDDVWLAWDKCFKKIRKKPRLKSVSNKMSNIPFPDPLIANGNRIGLRLLGKFRFYGDLPEGKLKRARLCKRASGWYLAVWVDAEPVAIKHAGDRVIGIDPGYKFLLTTSDGEKVAHPQELKAAETRLAQAQRGGNKRLVARLQERIANQRKDRNHKLSARLVAECSEIYFSKDRVKALQKTFGKSVLSAGHTQLASMLAYKSAYSGRKFGAPDSRRSTMTCSACGALTGPSGFAGLSIRHWVCSCGAAHDRDINSAINALVAGRGLRHGSGSDAAFENSKAKRLVAFCS